METPKPMQGTWMLTRPDGKHIAGESPLHCVRAEMNERVPPSVQLARVMAAVDEPDFAERHVELGQFYSAANVDDLIDKMEAHIARLQEKVASTARPFSFAPQRVREG
jgi:ADP-ribose pyrophosphatase YjhB (NUDIX family)